MCRSALGSVVIANENVGLHIPFDRSGVIVNESRVFAMAFAKVYPMYVQKAERKGRAKDEVDEAICWLTGYNPTQLAALIEQQVDFRTFFANAPDVEQRVPLVTGVVCGVRVETVEDPLMRQIRCLDKLVDELAKGKAMTRILRG